MPENMTGPWWGNMLMYWLEDQVVITFHSDVPFSSISTAPITTAPILRSLKLDHLNQFLNARGFTLKPFTEKDVARPMQRPIPEHAEGRIEGIIEDGNRQGEPPRDDLSTITGKYFFPAPSDPGTLVVTFFNIDRFPTPHASQDAMILFGREGVHADESNTRNVVNMINGNLDKIRNMGKVPIVGAMPNWLGGSTGQCPTHSCPIVPPIPVPDGEACNASSGSWPISLPDLHLESTTSPLHGTTGEGVTVFVLDSMPDIKHQPDLIAQVAAGAGTHNALLNKIALQKDRLLQPFIKFTYQDLPEDLAENASDLIITGKDLYGRLFGFNSADHGLFITGMIRDIVPEANIEYIRVLNDFGVGDTSTLIAALEGILGRMIQGGDLHDRPVVINLSLVNGPSQDDLVRLWFDDEGCCMPGEHLQMTYDVEVLRGALHVVIQSLTTLGAVVVASAGNDSDVESWRGTMAGNMPQYAWPRYPAAFPEAISVGAVDKDGRAARYSCYPALFPNHNGIATYGGGIPTPIPSQPDPSVTTRVDMTTIDAPRGVFSASRYPKLSADDPQPDYPDPNPYAWAYWSGTSFATPIISAVAARILEKIKKDGHLPSHLWSQEVQWALTTAAGQKKLLTGKDPLPLQPDFSLGTGVGISLLMAYQCEEQQVEQEAREHESAHTV